MQVHLYINSISYKSEFFKVFLLLAEQFKRKN